jgi:hypothetical protein
MKGEAKWKPLMHSSNLPWSPTTTISPTTSPTTFTDIQTPSTNNLKFYKIKVIDDGGKKCFITTIRTPNGGPTNMWWIWSGLQCLKSFNIFFIKCCCWGLDKVSIVKIVMPKKFQRFFHERLSLGL